MKYILFLLLLIPFVSRADAIARHPDGDWVLITALPCKNEKVLGFLAEAKADPNEYREAKTQIGGKPFAACWRLRDEPAVYLRFEDGDQGFVHRSEFEFVESK